MGLLDKVKAQTEQLAAKAQQGMVQGQAKIDALQAKRAGDVLLHELGRAYYAQQRAGGSADAVTAALAALDQHVAEHGPLDAPATAAGSTALAPAPAAAAPTTTAPAGDFKLDDL
jgi:hypothetical protein